MRRGILQNWSEKTKGVKIDNTWYEGNKPIIELAKEYGKGAEINYDYKEEGDKKVLTMFMKVGEAIKEENKENGRFIPLNIQIRESALRSAVESLSKDTDWTADAVIQRARVFEKYIKGEI